MNHFSYNGPDSQMVDYQFRIRKYESYLSVNFNVIIAIMDGRGTTANGEKFKKAVYKQLGKLEATDQVLLAT
jgi:dipeptidyl-peptidase-4